MTHMATSVTQLTGQAMQVDSYLVDVGAGIVVVDAQLHVDGVVAVRAAVRRTGAPLLEHGGHIEITSLPVGDDRPPTGRTP